MPMTNYEMFDFPGDTKRDEYFQRQCAGWGRYLSPRGSSRWFSFFFFLGKRTFRWQTIYRKNAVELGRILEKEVEKWRSSWGKIFVVKWKIKNKLHRNVMNFKHSAHTCITYSNCWGVYVCVRVWGVSWGLGCVLVCALDNCLVRPCH